MKTIEMKIKIIFKLKNKDLIFNSTQVKVEIFWVEEKNKVYRETKTTYKKYYHKLFNFLIF